MSAPTAIPGELPATGLLLADRRRLARLRSRIVERSARRLPVARELTQLRDSLAAAVARYESRRQSVPTVRYPDDLPVAQRIEEVRAALAGNQVVVICGETGSGKTTQLPKACLEVGRGLTGLIGHTQPRRIAARSVAARLAEELGCALGEQVGFKVRFAEKASDASLIRVMTDGILLAEIHDDPDLVRYDTLIIDEAHERSLNIDFLIGYLRRLLPRRPDLKLIITSATIDPQRFAAFFDAPVIEVSGRAYPVESLYRPLTADEDDDLDPGLIPGIVGAVRELESLPASSRGDVLVFVPGEREIREAAEALAQASGARYEILPLYSRLSWSEQQRVFTPSRRPRVVLATNVAETSLTVPGIRSVVDSGLARISRYSTRSKILRLPIEPVSQASADQRRGRCGRIAPGVCIRLYSEDDYAARPRFTPPEILRTNLASVILQMGVLGLGDVELFPFLDPPDTRQVSDGYRLLRELEAVDDERRVTELGRTLARIPLDPRLGRMLAEARRLGALRETLVLAAVLSMQDPRERPQDAQAEADQRHSQWADARSDFTTLLNLWTAWQGVRGETSNSQARRWCRENFLSAARMREWEELVDQLNDATREFDWRPNMAPAGYEAVHRSLLPGLLGNLGEKTDRGDYLGVRGLRFHVAPGTPLRARLPRWVMAATITETHRVYARTVAAIEPEWIEAAAHHIVKRAYTDPEWSEQRGAVTAVESVSLFGLAIATARRVNYGSVEPEAARQIFVREALVHRRCRLRARFLERNARVRATLEGQEARLRRSGVLLDEDRVVSFYLGRIPASVHSLQGFERWRRDAEAREPGLLEFSREDVLADGAPEVDLKALPDGLLLGGHELPVAYRFEPGADDDGATVRIPLPLLARLETGEVEWGIPGWRHELLTALIRGLPKSVRRALVPAPDVAAECLKALGASDARSFLDAVAEWLSRRAGMPVGAAELRAIPVAVHLRLNLCVTDLDGRVLRSGRNLDELKRALACERADALERSAEGFARVGLRDWSFGDLPEAIAVSREGLALTLYPAVEDRRDSAALTLRDDRAEADRLSQAGVMRLLALRLEGPLKHVRKAMAADAELALLYQGLGQLRRLADDVCDRAVERCCLPAGTQLPRSREAFEAAAERGRADLYEEAMRIVGVVKRALGERRAAIRELASLPDGVDAELAADTRAQLDDLLREGVVGAVPDPWLDSLPRFARAVARRAARLRTARGTTAQPHWDVYELRRQVAALAAEREKRAIPPGEAGTLLRWMVEELSVSFFAQELRTSLPVSPKRLRQQLDLARAELRR